jgi:hypothetical protein
MTSIHAYSKVMMKIISFVIINCYSAKEWIERRKRKQLVKKELNRMKPSFQLFKSNGEFWLEKWKQFKVDYNVTSATIQVFKASGKEFIFCAKQKQYKNKTTEWLSSYVKEFFWIFSKQKKEFVKPAG